MEMEKRKESEGCHVTPLILDAQYLKGLLLKVSRIVVIYQALWS
jgi:hypothetical protein